MLDIKFIRENPDSVKRGLSGKRVPPAEIDHLLALDSDRRKYLVEVDTLKAKKNKISEEVGRLKSKGADATALFEEGKTLSQKITEFDAKVGDIDSKIAEKLLTTPNLPDSSVPIGDPSLNKVIRE